MDLLTTDPVTTAALRWQGACYPIVLADVIGLGQIVCHEALETIGILFTAFVEAVKGFCADHAIVLPAIIIIIVVVVVVPGVAVMILIPKLPADITKFCFAPTGL